MQQIYWSKMYYYKYCFFYLSLHFQKNVSIDRTIKIVTAIVSSLSIAAWATWTNLAFLCGALIAGSQVITAISDYLPYKKRISEISAMLTFLSQLYIDVEREWYKVANGQYTEEEINTLTYDFAQRWSDIDNKFFKEDSLPVNEKLQKRAEQEAAKYIQNTFKE